MEHVTRPFETENEANILGTGLRDWVGSHFSPQLLNFLSNYMLLPAASHGRRALLKDPDLLQVPLSAGISQV
ncbi:MAG: hypothetical protein R3C53_23025 [Pirellulaceae bacterium]